MTASNKGQHTAMALDTLGNAYMYLREVYSTTTTWNTPEGRCRSLALLAAADILHESFDAIKAQFELIDFTQRS